MKTGSKGSSGKKKGTTFSARARRGGPLAKQSAKPKLFKLGRDVRTGEYVPVKSVRRGGTRYGVKAVKVKTKPLEKHRDAAGIVKRMHETSHVARKVRLSDRDGSTGKFIEFLNKPRSPDFEKVPKNASSLVDEVLYKR